MEKKLTLVTLELQFEYRMSQPPGFLQATRWFPCFQG